MLQCCSMVRQRLEKASFLMNRARSSRRFFSSDNDAQDGVANALVRLSQQNGGLETFAQRLSPAVRQQVFEELKATATEAELTVPEPSRADLKAVSFATAVPFVGFGLMDNSILIIAGDAIDTSLGVTLGISTMCAAALGNIISDIAGIGLGTVIEDFCAKYLPLPAPNLTSAQRRLRSVRWANQWGCLVGIVIGCIIGMFPLLYIDSNKIQKLKREAHLDGIFRDVISSAGSLIGAQRSSLFLVVDKPTTGKGTNPVPNADGKFLYAKYDPLASTSKSDRYIPLGKGIVSRAALSGEAWNIYDVRTEPEFTPESGGHDSNEQLSPEMQIRNMVCVPVLGAHGRAIAVIQSINKVSKGSIPQDERFSVTAQEGGFTNGDVQVLKALASHISVALQRMYDEAGDEGDMRLKDTIRMLKDYGLQGITDRSNEKRSMLFPED